MSIVIIKGPAQSGKSITAQALRSRQISYQRGALLVDEGQEGDLRGRIEKLLVAVTLPAEISAEKPVDVKTLPWKPDPMIILVGDDSFLKEAEALLPGFTEHFGPIYTITTGKA